MAERNKFEDYLRLRFEHLNLCRCELGELLDLKRAELAGRVDTGEIKASDSAIGAEAFRIGFVLGVPFQYLMLVAISAWLEEVFYRLCEDRHPDYAALLRKRKKGTWLRKHVEVLKKEFDVDFGEVHNELERLLDCVELRNCIVHAWGRISRCRNAKKVWQIISQRNDLDETKDGYLVVYEDFVGSVFADAEDVLDYLLSRLEELDDIRAYDEAKLDSQEAVPFEQAVREIQKDLDA